MDKFWLKSYEAGVPAEIDWTQYRSLTHLLEDSFRKFANRDAFACMGKSMTFAELDKPGVLEAVEIPVYIVATDHDRLVSFAAIERAARRLPRADLNIFGAEAYHEILREIDPIRNLAVDGIDGFLTVIAERQAGGR